MSDVIYHLKSPATPGPNCNFELNDPAAGMVGSGYIIRVLAINIAAWRKANGIPIGLGFEQEVEQAVCRKYPDLCFSEDPRAPLQPVALSYNDVLVGTSVMASLALRLATTGKGIVTQAEAERRAAICSTCKFNVQFHKGCGGGLCGKLLELVRSIVPGGTSRDDSINACYICHCLLKASVWVDQDLQWNPLHQNQKTQFTEQAAGWCWKVPK